MKLFRNVFQPATRQTTIRQIQTTPYWFSASKTEPKSSLASLRKKTGYSLSLCKQALAETDFNLDKAEKWLEEQAQAQGWSKAQKLQGRNTTQGLVGLFFEGNLGAMVELNCETDFVARNSKFHTLLNEVITTKFNLLKSSQLGNASDSPGLQHWSQEQLSVLQTENGRTFADLLALNIGQIGENIILRRGITLKCKEGHRVTGLTHPSGSPVTTNRVHFGRYGALLSFYNNQTGQLPEGQTEDSMARQLCQHIIGMNPKQVGNFEDKSTWPSTETFKSSTSPAIETNTPRPEGETDEEDTIHTHDPLLNQNEETMIHQTFLMDPELLVRDVLFATGLRLVDFARFELGRAPN